MPEQTEPLIAVQMTAYAAEQLAKACAWAESRAWDEENDPAVTGEKHQRAVHAYTWLSWGHHWLASDESRAPAKTKNEASP